MISTAVLALHAPAIAVFLDSEQDQQDQMRAVIDKAGPIAGLFVLLLGIALFFLFRSMSRQMKKIDPNLPAGPDDREQAMDREYTEEAIRRGEEDGQG